MEGGVAAGIASAIAAIIAALVAWRKGGTENWSALLGAQGKHMDMLSAENNDLRARQTQQEKDYGDRLRQIEQRLNTALMDVARCEHDKIAMQGQIDLLMEERRGGR